MPHDLDLQLLRTFVAILDTGGLTRAGKKIGRTQPVISHQIGRLEERLGRPLFATGRSPVMGRYCSNTPAPC